MAHRYFLSYIDGGRAVVENSEADHLIKVMRIKTGDTVTLCGKDGYDYTACAKEIHKDKVIFEILEKRENPAQPKKQVTVYMALPKSDKLEFIVQKSCELGAAFLTPFVSEYCVAQKSKKEEEKLKRLNKISLEAAKQCGRSIPMQVNNTLTFKQLLEDLKKNDINLFFYENSTTPFSQKIFENAEKIGVIIGSEGGFSQKECDLFSQQGALNLSLGKRILRCETAAVTALALTMFSAGEME